MLRKILSIALTLVATTATAAAVAQENLHLMANTSPPYADAKLPHRGLALELVNEVFSSTDYGVEISIENWSRAVEGARLGVFDGLAAAWYSDERAENLLFSEPYLQSDLIILKRRDNHQRYDDLEDLAGARLGVRTDYAYGVDFAAVPRLTLVQENHLIQNLLRLRNGSVDFVIGDRRTVNQQLHEFMRDSAGELAVTGIVVKPVARHVAISRLREDHAEIVAAFNKALAAMRKDGSHAEILKKWEARYQGLL